MNPNCATLSVSEVFHVGCIYIDPDFLPNCSTLSISEAFHAGCINPDFLPPVIRIPKNRNIVLVLSEKKDFYYKVTLDEFQRALTIQRLKMKREEECLRRKLEEERLKKKCEERFKTEREEHLRMERERRERLEKEHKEQGRRIQEWLERDRQKRLKKEQEELEWREREQRERAHREQIRKERKEKASFYSNKKKTIDKSVIIFDHVEEDHDYFRDLYG
jgi:hypothetical protein